MSENKFKMSISLNVLNHLGINLYSNIPAVLAETIANSWDADAENVTVKIDLTEETIVIQDDGHGMTDSDINDKYLTVGYQRRENSEAVTPKHNRRVMGRKGIGKLSLFSIADTIEIHSAKDGAVNGLIMSLPSIKAAIDEDKDQYAPEEIDASKIHIKKGTKIILRDLRKKMHLTAPALKKRLARRFSIIGPQNKFAITVDDDSIGITDRDYYHKLQYVWLYGDGERTCEPLFTKASKKIVRPGTRFTGWIGTAEAVGHLQDDGENLNRIVVMIRGKLAQEDILESFGERGVYSNYLMGEIHADFLDTDDEEDIATSSRQSIVEDDERFQKLKEEIQTELKHIQNQWTDYRNEQGKEIAVEIPAIGEWFGALGRDDKDRAKKLFGRINQLTMDDTDHRQTLIKYGVLAFENLKAKNILNSLEGISADNLVKFAEIFGLQDDLEATLYYQIISGRIEVVRALQENVENDVLEKVIQKHLFDHLWLLDPSWERATSTEYMEKNVQTEFSNTVNLTEAEKSGRVDIKYMTAGGKHIVIELKRASASVSTDSLLSQVRKYLSALKTLLRNTGKESEPIEIICVVGKSLSDWSDPDGRRISKNQFIQRQST